MNTKDTLSRVFSGNFVTYYQSHVAHVNTVGRNFIADHELLGEIYLDLQSQIDTIAELLRTVGGFMPANIADTVNDSEVYDDRVEGSADALLEHIAGSLAILRELYVELMEDAEADAHKEIANYAQDRILAISKFIWKLESTLG